MNEGYIFSKMSQKYETKGLLFPQTDQRQVKEKVIHTEGKLYMRKI